MFLLTAAVLCTVLYPTSAGVVFKTSAVEIETVTVSAYTATSTVAAGEGMTPDQSNVAMNFEPGTNGNSKQQQNGAPWALARLSHNNYVFSADGNTFESNPNNAYFYTTSSDPSNVTIYLLDTGVEVTHQQFGGRAVLGPSFVRGEANEDLNGHGTHLAGSAIGNTVGTARQASLVSVKVLNKDRIGEIEDFDKAVDWVISHHQNSSDARAIINYSATGEISQLRASAINRAIDNDIFVIAAAGNDAENSCSVGPGNMGPSLDGLLIVAALNYTNTPANFTNYGKCVDIYSPGVDIYSSLPWSPDSYGYMDGTSNAAATVSGLVAYLWGLDPDITLDQMTSLVKTANPNAVQANIYGTTGSIVYNMYAG